MKNVFILCAFIVLLQGCASRGTGGSYVGENLALSVNESITKDFVAYFSLSYPSGHTDISLLTPEENAKNDFSLLLEDEFRKKGYTIKADSELPIAYTVDSLENLEYYLQVRMPDFSLSRMYDVNGIPISNWTKKVME